MAMAEHTCPRCDRELRYGYCHGCGTIWLYNATTDIYECVAVLRLWVPEATENLATADELREFC